MVVGSSATVGVKGVKQEQHCCQPRGVMGHKSCSYYVNGLKVACFIIDSCYVLVMTCGQTKDPLVEM